MASVSRYGQLLATRLNSMVQSPLPSKLKWRIFRSYLGLLARRPLKSGAGVIHVPVLDYRVATYSLWYLQYMYEEIFIFLRYLFRCVREDPYIIDCGSNIGMSILFFKALYPEAKVVGFEPAEHAHTLLQENIAANDLSDVQVNNLAVGREDAEVDFYFDSDNPASLIMSTDPRRVARRVTKECYKVRQVQLSKYVECEVDFLKLDVEGAESAVLEELIESGAIDAIDQMVVEYHHHIDGGEDDFGAFLRQLEARGFGYQIGGTCPPAVQQGRGHGFQDVHVYAYRKSGSAAR
jgi:FkbM family methyltransferase